MSQIRDFSCLVVLCNEKPQSVGHQRDTTRPSGGSRAVAIETFTHLPSWQTSRPDPPRIKFQHPASQIRASAAIHSHSIMLLGYSMPISVVCFCGFLSMLIYSFLHFYQFLSTSFYSRCLMILSMSLSVQLQFAIDSPAK